jgi:hypothetical protein
MKSRWSTRAVGGFQFGALVDCNGGPPTPISSRQADISHRDPLLLLPGDRSVSRCLRDTYAASSRVVLGREMTPTLTPMNTVVP